MNMPGLHALGSKVSQSSFHHSLFESRLRGHPLNNFWKPHALSAPYRETPQQLARNAFRGDGFAFLQKLSRSSSAVLELGRALLAHFLHFASRCPLY